MTKSDPEDIHLKITQVFLVVLILFSISVLRAGTVIQFTDRTAFDAAVGTTTLETFGTDECWGLQGPINSSTSQTCTYLGPLAAGTLQPGATYSAPIVSGYSFNLDGGGDMPESVFLDSLLLGRSSAPLTVTFDDPVAAVGFDTGNHWMGTSLTITFNFTTGNEQDTYPIAGTAPFYFFGFQSSASDIQSVVISGNNSPSQTFGFEVGDFAFGGSPSTASAIPEPSEILPLAGAIGLLFGVLRGIRRPHGITFQIPASRRRPRWCSR